MLLTPDSQTTKIHHAEAVRKSAARLARLKDTAHLLLLVAFMLTMASLLAYYGADMANDALALRKPDATLTLSLTEDTTLAELCERLEACGVIKYRTLFYLGARKDLRAQEPFRGELSLNTNMSYRSLKRALTKWGVAH